MSAPIRAQPFSRSPYPYPHGYRRNRANRFGATICRHALQCAPFALVVAPDARQNPSAAVLAQRYLPMDRSTDIPGPRIRTILTPALTFLW